MPLPWNDTLKEIREKANKKAGVVFTHALLNLYRDGKDSVSWHRNSEKVWGPELVIGSFSLGQKRTIQVRNL